jgi:ABC-2 type transport system ATP-binding protein/lipopolysaccharide transport system ATP-binding protein
VSAIVVQNVSKKFRLQTDRAHSVKELVTRRDRNAGVDKFWALRNVSLEIPEGSMYALVGPNGCGKSTLLRCIAGIYRPTEGQVKVSGRISTLLELGAGFHPDLTGRENVYMNATILGLTKKEIDESFDSILDFAGIEEFIDSPVKIYSSGMYIRLGFSVAVHVNPEILLIDEVIAVGDEEFQRKCFDHLYGLRKQGVTIVVVTHGMGTVQTMCDGAAWLDHGVLQKEGDAIEVAAAYLDHVNEAEDRDRRRSAERVESTTTGVLAADPDGSPIEREPIQILSVSARNSDGVETQSVDHGDSVDIVIRYEASEHVSDLAFGYAIHSDGGAHVCGSHTGIARVDDVPPAVPGEGEAVFHIPDLQLTPGTYDLSAAIADRRIQHMYDRMDRSSRLFVRHGSVLSGAGFVEMPGSWSFGRGEGLTSEVI